MIENDFLPQLHPVTRLALAYAPRANRLQWLAFLALDIRLAGIVRNSREPMLAQLRLAWWREQLRQDSAAWPEGEPLLAALRSWDGKHGELAPLVDGWEAITGTAPLPGAAFLQLADARGTAFAALTDGACNQAEAKRLGRNWALVDIAGRLTHPQERAAVAALAGSQDWRGARLPRALRPLVVLHGLAARSLRAGENVITASPGSLVTAMRLGLLGR